MAYVVGLGMAGIYSSNILLTEVTFLKTFTVTASLMVLSSVIACSETGGHFIERFEFLTGLSRARELLTQLAQNLTGVGLELIEERRALVEGAIRELQAIEHDDQLIGQIHGEHGAPIGRVAPSGEAHVLVETTMRKLKRAVENLSSDDQPDEFTDKMTGELLLDPFRLLSREILNESTIKRLLADRNTDPFDPSLALSMDVVTEVPELRERVRAWRASRS